MDRRVALKTQLAMWRLIEQQAALRSQLQGVQAEISSLPDRSYRRFTRNCWRMRQDAVKQVQR